MRLSSPRNSKRRKISRSCERSGGASTSCGRVEVELEVAAHRRELLGGARVVLVLDQVLAPRRARARRRARSTPSSEPYCAISCPAVLSPMPGTPGMLSDVSPLRPMKSGICSRPDPVARLDALRRVHLHVADAARRHHQADVVGHELERVAVGRHDARLHACLVGARRERGDHVVRLPALELEVAVAERLDDRAEVRELLPQQIGHRAAALLVDDVGRLGDGGAMHGPRVPRDGNALRLVVAEAA